jgi:hypothetical protein
VSEEREGEGETADKRSKLLPAISHTTPLPPHTPSRAKASILEVDLPALHKLLAKRGIVKALTPEQLADRRAQLAAARDLVAAVPDGVHAAAAGGPSLAGRAGLLGDKAARKKGGKGGAAAAISLVAAAGRGGPGASTSSSSSTSPPGGRADADGYWAQSEAATAFRSEFEASKARQDKVMDGIERGLGDLKEIGAAMGRALDEQYVLTAAIDDKVRERMRERERGLGLVGREGRLQPE